MIEKIPKQLQNEKFGFCKIAVGSKKPIEPNWPDKPYKYDSKELNKYTDAGGNYGTITGYGDIRILDVDKLDLVPIFDKLFSDTFSVQTPSGGRHYYFISDYNTNHVLKDRAGELRCSKMQCVGPNCEVD
ncbi:MAG: bifunctional DNA primase/polymerase [Nanoarchaeota archaeon]|nr:bifunctional DNA primase/polymerase [Nanoarchaeota archaeon]